MMWNVKKMGVHVLYARRYTWSVCVRVRVWRTPVHNRNRMV